MTEVLAKEVYVVCPKCDERVDGWYGDPRGREGECEHCGATFTIHKEADIDMR